MSRTNYFDFIDALNDFASELYRLTGKRCVLRVDLDSEYAINLGILPGGACTFYLATGPVMVTSEKAKEKAPSVQGEDLCPMCRAGKY